MKTRKYKTLKGLVMQSNQISIEKLFSNDPIVINKKVVRFLLSDSAKLDAAKMFANYLLSSSSAKKRLINGLINGYGDLSYFHCFYIGYNKTKKYIYLQNSLSGDAFEYCKRMYLRSV